MDLFEWAKSRRRQRGPGKNNKSVRDRFEGLWMPEPNSGCWLWMGYIYPNGYGNFNSNRRRGSYAHRVSYELYKGPIPAGLELDHLCRNRCCVNPDHLEPVTSKENKIRSPITNAGKKFCKWGHLFDQENTRFEQRDMRKIRQCRACDRERHRTYKNDHKKLSMS